MLHQQHQLYWSGLFIIFPFAHEWLNRFRTWSVLVYKGYGHVVLLMLCTLIISSRWAQNCTRFIRRAYVLVMKTKMVVFDFRWPFSKFYRFLKLSENKNNYKKNKNENSKIIWKWKRKWLEHPSIIFENYHSLGYSTVFYW